MATRNPVGGASDEELRTTKAWMESSRRLDFQLDELRPLGAAGKATKADEGPVRVRAERTRAIKKGASERTNKNGKRR
ncbi:hypothetical protein BHE74_00006127 [Ensete ventricosum]|nr:hypothetical protein BHE74_00006127 [Ensete ventricosum]